MMSVWIFVLICVSFSATRIDCLTQRASRSKERLQERSPIYIGGLLPNGEYISAITHAVRDINNHADVLPKHQLQFIFRIAPFCDVNLGLQKYLDLVEILPRKLLLLNGVCTEVILAINEISKNSNGSSNYSKMLQVSYGNSDSIFDGPTKYPFVFRVLPSELTFNEPRTRLLLEILSKVKNGISGIGLIYQNTQKYFIPHEDQVSKLLSHRVSDLESESFENNATVEDLKGVLKRLKEKNVNIILGNFDSNWSRKIFCLAYKEKMYGKNYTWILSGDYEPKWWRFDDTECFPHEIETALYGMVRVDILPFSSDFIEKTTPELRSLHYSALNASKLHRYAYDAVWAIAVALKNSNYYYNQVTKQKSDPTVDYLTNSSINYQNPNWDIALHKSLASLSLIGSTGPIRFSSNQGRLSYSLVIKQFQALPSGYDEVNIGEFDSINKTLNMNKYPHKWIWKNLPSSVRMNSEFELQNPRHNEHVTGDGYDLSGGSDAHSCDLTMIYIFLINFIAFN